MTISENLVRHLYVLNTKQDDLKEAVASGDASLGDFAVLSPEGEDYMAIQHYGHGGITRSDIIPFKNVLFANATAAADLAKTLKTATIALNEDSIIDEETDGIKAGTYIVRIKIDSYIGMSDEEPYFKYGQVTSNGTLSVEDFYKKMAKSLQKNFSREAVKMLEIAGPDEEAETLTITEVEQPWKRGKMQRVPVRFTVELVSNDDLFEPEVGADDEGNLVATYDWGTVTYGVAEDTLTNAKDIADLEYFCMGERADNMRGAGYPNNWDTEYLVDANAEDGYAVLDIHYAYVGANESCQKSEKTLTLVAEDAAAFEDIISLLESEDGAGITVKKSASYE